jgi:leucine dehydrogenase
MRACCRHRFGSARLEGRRVVVIGMGHCGDQLVRRLVAAGADVAVADIDPAKRSCAAELGAEWVEPADAIAAECDVLAPCALGGVIDTATLPLLRCAVVCGSANNQLADEGLDRALADQGILFAPDFIVNAGGLIHVYMEIRGYSERAAAELVVGIETTMNRVLETADERRVTALAAALALAEERLSAAAASPVAAR